MYSSLLSPGERDADHPARGSMFPAFAVQEHAAPSQRRQWLAGVLTLVAAASIWVVLR